MQLIKFNESGKQFAHHHTDGTYCPDMMLRLKFKKKTVR